MTLEHVENLSAEQHQMLEDVLAILRNALDDRNGNSTPGRSAAVLYFDTDSALRISHINEQLAGTLGMPADEFIGCSALDLILPEGRAALEAPLLDGHRGPLERLVTLQAADGFLLLLRATVVPIVADGLSRGWRWLFQDVTGKATYHAAPPDFPVDDSQPQPGVACVGLDSEWQRVNLALCQMLDVSAEELLTGETLWNRVHADDIEKEMVHTANLLAGKVDRYTLDLRYLRRDGSRLWVRQTASLVKDEQGQPRGKFVVLEDIDNQKHAEETLMPHLNDTQKHLEVSRAIGAARTPDAVLNTLLSAGLWAARRGALLVFDHHWEDTAPVSMSVLAEWPRGQAENSLAGESYTLQDYGLQTLYRRDKRLVLPGDENRPMNRAYFDGVRSGSLLLFPLIANGAWYGMLALHCDSEDAADEIAQMQVQRLVDQTAGAIYTMLLQESEAQAHREADRSTDLRMQVLATMAQELRTPIMSIQGFVGALVAEDVTWDPVSQRDFIETIGREANRMQELVDLLVDHARIESGTLRIEPEMTSLHQVVEIAGPRLTSLAANHELIISLSEDLPFLTIDSQRVAQVLVNLVSNAVKFSPIYSRVYISARPEGEHVRVDVSDEGPGIAPEDAEHIFEAFYQGQNSPQNAVSGLGLGLTISEAIIKAQGGSLKVCTPHRGGACISFTLPVAAARGSQGA